MRKALSSPRLRRPLAFSLFFLALVSGAVALWPNRANDTNELILRQRLADIAQHPTSVPGSCIVFVASIGDRVLFANNEDYTNYNTFYWTDPSKNGEYGGLYFGFDDHFPQGGMNEKGLMFDYTSLPPSTILPDSERPHREPQIYDVEHWSDPSKLMTIMRHAATVEEAIEVAKQYDWSGVLLWEVLLADAKGDAVVISAGPKGKLAFTRKAPGDGFMVLGNVNLANPTNHYGPYPCPNMALTTEGLRAVQAEGHAAMTLPRLSSILKSVDADGPTVNTVYSDILDPTARKAYLYYWHQYGRAAELDVAAEMAKGTGPTPIRSLFPVTAVQTAKVRHFYHRNTRLVKASAVAAAIASVVCGILLVRKKKDTRTLPPQPFIAVRT